MRHLQLRIVLALSAFAASASAQCVSLVAGGTYTQNLDSLANTGTSAVVPAGWAFSEASTNANTTYTAGNGSSNAGETYSFGATGSTDRALGGLRSGALVPTVGACFTNNTGAVIGRLNVSYSGEQWRLGTANRGVADRLDFEYSADATSLTTGAWTGVDGLDFSSPVISGAAAALDGNLAPNRTAIAGNVGGLSIPVGGTIWIRWTDFDVTGADDGLGVDDFSVAPAAETGLSISDSNVAEGDAGAVTANVTVSLNAVASADVTFDIATADDSALAASGDYVAKSLTAQRIPQGQTSYTFTVQVNGDTAFEPNEAFLVNLANVSGAIVVKGSARVTILNDDVIPISRVQGPGNNSPLAGQPVAVRGIVTARKSNGFFVQTPDASVDFDPLTSEGVFVFTSSTPPSAAAAGNLVLVTGTAVEFVPEPNSPSLTEIGGTPSVTLISTGNALPAPVTLSAADTRPGGGLFQLEKYEGMRVRVNSLSVVGPTDGTLSEANATASSSGVFYGIISGGVIAGLARPFREPGIETPDPSPAGAPVWDSNPERLRVDSDAQPGATAIDVAAGALVADLVGPLDYGFRTYTILPDPATPPTVIGNIAARPVPAPAADQFTVASYNMERFYDTVNDPATSDVALTPTAFANRLAKASLVVRNILRLPDILAVEEMENLATLQELANRINADAAADGSPSPKYAPYLTEGNDIGGIDIGFLVKTTRVNVVSVVQEGKAATYVPASGSAETLNDRPPLILEATINPPTGTTPFPITVIANHLRSLIGVDDATDGPRVRAKRAAQAEYLANLVQARQVANPAARIVVVGDFNAFPFSDGYVDMVGTVRGAPTPAANVVLAGPDLVNPDLADAADTLPPSRRYSYVFDGSAQTIDQLLFTQTLQPYFAGLEYGRVGADFPEVYRNDATRPERLSDHDPVIAYFRFTRPDLTLGVTSAPAPTAGQTVVYTLRVGNTLGSAATGVELATTIPAGLATFASIAKPAIWSCLTPAVGAAGAVRCTAPSLAAGANDSILLSVAIDSAVPNGTPLPLTAIIVSPGSNPPATVTTFVSGR